MKKTVLLLIAVILSLQFFSGCHKKEDMNQKAKDAYISFLKEQFKDNDISFIFKDIDGNGTDELIVIKKTIMIFYAFNEEITEIGDWNNINNTFRFLSSDNPSYPGIISFYVGWDENIYGYITIKDNKLHFEELWIEYTSEESLGLEDRIKEISDDKLLIEESRISYNENKDIEFLHLDDID